MKKGLALLLALMMLLSLTACSLTFLNNSVGNGEDKDDKADPPVQSQEPAIPDAPAEPDAPVEPEAPGLGEEPLLPDPDRDDAPDAGEDGQTREITPSHTDVTLKEGETFTMSARDVPGIYACTFSSADPAVAEVDETLGTVTAVAPGTTTVTMRVECELGQFDFDCIIRCNWKAEGEASQPVSGPDAPSTGGLPSLSDFYATLQGSYEGLGAMMVMEGELLDNYYPGLSGIAAVEEVLIQETMISMANIAVGLVRLSDSATMEDIVAVQNILQARIDSQADGGAFYPESCETWKAGVITSISNRVGMFVYPDDAKSMSDLFVASYTN